MKILFVTSLYPSEKLPQYCIFLEQQALALMHLGHEVQVYHLSDENQTAQNEAFYHGILVHRAYNKMKKSKINLIIPRKIEFENLRDLEILLTDHFDVVSFHFGGMELFLSINSLCKKHSVPLIHHFHGLNIWKNYYDPHPALTKYWNIIKEFYYAKLSAVVNVSNKVKNEFERRIIRVPTFTVYNGVDVERFPFFTDREFFANKTIRILCVANLIPIKGQRHLIEAAEELKNQDIPVRLTFAGRGPDEIMLKRLALDKKVDADFVGYLPYDKVSELMKTHDLFIMPSFFEALGCVYLEAMSSGMITVGVKGQGIDEVILDGENGFLIEPQYSKSIADTVIRILGLSDNERKRISQAGRETSKQFTWDASAKALESVYKEVLERNG